MCTNRRLRDARAFGTTVYHDMDGVDRKQAAYSFPKIKRDTYHFAVHFPRPNALPLSEILLWGLCALVLLGVVTGLWPALTAMRLRITDALRKG